MADIFSKLKRSEIMAKIYGNDTKPEIMVRSFLFRHGFRFRKNDKRYPGKPDIVLPKYNTVIFIHGCFWHGHNCKKGKLPTTNTEFWREKISKSQKRDLKNKISLEKQGWKIIEIWTCEIKNMDSKEERLQNLIMELKVEP